jgi:GntR family transcriptional regulator / MocR family aminotransferase
LPWYHYQPMRKPARNDLPAIVLKRNSNRPLNEQLRSEIAQIILAGKLRPGARLPSTRRLSQELGISRNTVNEAYDQLAAEGYLQSAVGIGTRVVPTLPPELLRPGRPQRTKLHGTRLSLRGNEIAKVTIALDRIESGAGTQIGNPALDLFPFDTWKRLMAQQVERLSHAEFGYANPAGFQPLREQIAAHLARSRGLRVTSNRIIVVAGAQQALDLTARLLLDDGDPVLFENPGYPGARAALMGAGAHLRPVAIDGEGMNVGSLSSVDRQARAAYVTPAHQFPLGPTMTLSRRLALLEWAEEQNAFILEDDYDGDFRHAGKPISAIASLDTYDRVIYVGTFSKVMLPSLRLGFMVVPEELVTQITSVRGFMDRHSPVLEQATLAAFLELGYFARHIRHMREVYTERRALLITELLNHTNDLLDIYAPETGAHIIANLHGISGQRAAKAIGTQEIAIVPLSHYYFEPTKSNGLLLNFANSTAAGIQRSVRNIARALRGQRRSKS